MPETRKYSKIDGEILEGYRVGLEGASAGQIWKTWVSERVMTIMDYNTLNKKKNLSPYGYKYVNIM